MKNKIIITSILLVLMSITDIKAQQGSAVKQKNNMNNTDLAAIRKSKVRTYFKKEMMDNLMRNILISILMM